MINITTPSGCVFTQSDLDLLQLMEWAGFIRWSDTPIQLNSGIDSHVYISGREDLTDNPKLEWCIGQKICDVVWAHSRQEDRQPCLIGIPTAGTALANAGALVSFKECKYQDPEICHRTMREMKKEHGIHQRWINGEPDERRHTYWLVDNVATDGQSKMKAADRAGEDGYAGRAMPTLIFVDRQQGAIERLTQAGFTRLVVVYNLLDITFCLSELRLWPYTLVRSVEEEIEAHQFPAA